MSATKLAAQPTLRERPTSAVLAEPAGLGFDERLHRYTLRGVELTSVTSLIGRFKRPFDAEAQAQRVALRDGRSAADVQREWTEKRDAAGALGKQAHEIIDRVLRAGSPLALDHESPHVRAAMRCVADWQSQGASIIATEQRLAWLERGLAGTVDALAWCDGAWWIIDWKTNEKLTLQAEPHWRAKMLDPVAHLDDVHGSHYALQLALYALMLREVYGIEIQRRVLVHLRPDASYAIHEMPRLDAEARDLVNAQWEW